MSLIDMKALKERIKNWSEMDAYYHPYSPYSKSSTIPIPELYDILTRMPTVDAVPVVRCKDCKYCSVNRYADGNVYCYVCIETDCGVEADDFCSWGERRKDE